MSKERIRVAVVTGSNRGIGLAIVRGLCSQFHGHVYVTSRDPQRGKEAVQKLEAEGLSPKLHQLDITSEESIFSLKKYMLDMYGGIDVLVNNAGIVYNTTGPSPIERVINTVATNFTGTLNMLKYITPIIQPHGRIVSLTAHHPGLLEDLTKQDLRNRFTKPDLSEEELVALMEQLVQDVKDGVHLERGWGSTFYISSKVGESALMLVYFRKLQQSGKEDVLINACTPGWVKTRVGGDKGTLTTDQGAETPIFCALLPLGSPSGKFWRNKAVVEW